MSDSIYMPQSCDQNFVVVTAVCGQPQWLGFTIAHHKRTMHSHTHKCYVIVS